MPNAGLPVIANRAAAKHAVIVVVPSLEDTVVPPAIKIVVFDIGPEAADMRTDIETGPGRKRHIGWNVFRRTPKERSAALAAPATPTRAATVAAASVFFIECIPYIPETQRNTYDQLFFESHVTRASVIRCQSGANNELEWKSSKFMLRKCYLFNFWHEEVVARFIDSRSR